MPVGSQVSAVPWVYGFPSADVYLLGNISGVALE